MDHTKIMLREFNAILGREHLYNTTFGNESWHVNSSTSSIRVVKFATSKNLVVKSTILQHQNSHKHICTCPDRKTHNDIDHTLINRRWYSGISVELNVISITVWWLQKLRRQCQCINNQHWNLFWCDSMCRS